MAPRHSVARLALLAACGASTVAPGRADLRVLQWNPHWQCFAWNANNCTQQAQHHLRRLLLERDLDFANVIELEAPDFAAPPGWASVSNAACGVDKVDLMYNKRRWTPSRSANSSAHGCMAKADRPFVIQRFDSTVGAGSLLVIGAHFPHPASLANSALEETMALKTALHAAGAAGGDERVILVADTNENEHTPSHGIMGHLMNLSNPVVSTSLEHTCCFDNAFKQRGFDRIVANFGDGMDTEVLFDPLPAWAHEVKAGVAKRGAFHKAILGTLALPTSNTTMSTTSTTSTTTTTTTTTTAASAMTTTTSQASALRGSTTGTAAAAPAVPAKDFSPTDSRAGRAMSTGVSWWLPVLVAVVQRALG